MNRVDDRPPQTRTDFVVSRDGTSVAYRTVGRGPAVLVIPGALGVASDFDALARELADRFTVHTVERRGRGESGPQGDEYSIERECEDLAALQGATGATLLVGHSFGGLIALEAARANNAFRKVAVYEPGVSIDGSIGASWASATRAQLARGRHLAAFITFARGVNPETTGKAPRWLLRLILPAAIRRREREQKYRLLPTAIREHAEAARLDNTYPRYRDVAAEVLLMAGKDAAITGAGRASRILLPVLPSATFAAFPKLDHFGPEKKPKQIAEAVSAFFTANGKPGPRRDHVPASGAPASTAGQSPLEPVISVRGLEKRYGDLEAVCGIDLAVDRGEIFALLGPNGAGKTTTVEILEGVSPPSAGEVRVLGIEPAAADGDWRDRVGVVLQESRPEPGLTVRECLRLYAGYYRAPREIEETIALVGLEAKAETLGEQLSGGQRRRLDVALALIGDPELIFLDEPTTGFDPSARRAAWDVIAGLRALGKTVFLTTHYMDEAEQLADRIAIIANGQIVAAGTPHTLAGRDRLAATIRFTLPTEVTADELPPSLRPLAEPSRDSTVTLRTESPLNHVRELAEWALDRDLDLPDLDLRRPTLEDVYLSLIEDHEATR